ncbi:hypothetical protein O9H85_22930 [Paenibacillus filicis]|uniref:Exosporium protein C n=1 Tax=Paenibacillus gyeongsangnamensis TaxID=3388067 RepID=A0ABT4QEH9_9BACL|nr:hypothetical protein [Paenibacillus filicis]MCZ8515218.1 hypothetical protein [Paenibacillus filicis]
MASSTGPLQNNVPNPATMIHVLISNDDLSATGIVELEIFINLGGTLSPIVHELFSISPLITEIKSYNVAGAIGFEVQYSVSATTNVVINVFSTDAMGNILGAQGVLSSETQMISQLTPVP